MTDVEFLDALESCRLSERDFDHAAHVRAAYLYLRQADFLDALEHTRQAIRRYAAHLGRSDRYHETITFAYVALIHQHICEGGDRGGWASFARENAELLDPGLLRRFYPADQLASDLARKAFLLPHFPSMMK